MRVLVIMALLAIPAWGDELVLKDGKTIEWKSIVDLGESYEVETKAGKKMTIKKAEIEKIEIKDTGVPLLTGALFTFDAKKAKLATVDLGRFLDLKKGQIIGNWSVANGVLTCKAGDRPSVFQTQFEPPLDEGYDLTVTIERTDWRGCIGIGLALPNEHQVYFVFDDNHSSISRPQNVEGKRPEGIHGMFFENGKPKTITIMVRENALIVRAEGKDLYLWTDIDWAKCSVAPEVAVPNKKALFFMVQQAAFNLSKMTVVVPMKVKK